MSWLSDYSQDVRRYTAYSEGCALTQILTQQGLWALLQYRLAAAVYRSVLPRAVKRVLLLVLVIWQKIIEVSTGTSLPYTALIGPGLYIGHFGNIIVNGNAVIGSNCNLSQGVTIGISGRGERRGVPRVGNRVYFGANAVAAGSITIGDDVIIGGNSLANADVPPHCTVVGVPAVIVSNKGSEEYICLGSAI
jgi:serine O-acetyltransferase